MQEYVQRKRLAKKWDTERTEESRQEYREMQQKVKVEVAKAKQRVYCMNCVLGWTARRERPTSTGK